MPLCHCVVLYIFFFPSLLHLLSDCWRAPLAPGVTLLAGLLGGDKFGGREAAQVQSRSLCARVVEQEMDQGGSAVSWTLIGPTGGREEDSLPEEKD